MVSVARATGSDPQHPRRRDRLAQRSVGQRRIAVAVFIEREQSADLDELDLWRRRLAKTECKCPPDDPVQIVEHGPIAAALGRAGARGQIHGQDEQGQLAAHFGRH